MVFSPRRLAWHATILTNLTHVWDVSVYIRAISWPQFPHTPFLKSGKGAGYIPPILTSRQISLLSSKNAPRLELRTLSSTTPNGAVLSLVEYFKDSTGNKPGIFHSRRQRRSVEAAHLACEEFSWGSRTTKTDVVVVIRRVVVVAIRHAQVVVVVGPTTPTQHLIWLIPTATWNPAAPGLYCFFGLLAFPAANQAAQFIQ